MKGSVLSLPPGFRFFPTDEELLTHYLCRKVAGHEFALPIIAEVDLYKFDPWLLPSKAHFGEKEWYFFSPRDRKYPNGSRPNRVAGSGYWKATGTDKIISSGGRKVGIKKGLVFYVGKAPKGNKTNWIMHEYRICDVPTKKSTSQRLDDWVLCRIYNKKTGIWKTDCVEDHAQTPSSCSSQLDNVTETLSDIVDRRFALPHVNSLNMGYIDSIQWTNNEDHFLSLPPLFNIESSLNKQGSARFGAEEERDSFHEAIETHRDKLIFPSFSLSDLLGIDEMLPTPKAVDRFQGVQGQGIDIKNEDND